MAIWYLSKANAAGDGAICGCVGECSEAETLNLVLSGNTPCAPLTLDFNGSYNATGGGPWTVDTNIGPSSPNQAFTRLTIFCDPDFAPFGYSVNMDYFDEFGVSRIVFVGGREALGVAIPNIYDFCAGFAAHLGNATITE